MVTLSRSVRRVFAGDPLYTVASMALDVLVIVLAYACALLLRFDGDVPQRSIEFTVRVLPIIAVLYIAANVGFGVYRTVWTYGSIGDVLNLFRPITLVTFGLFLVSVWLPERHLPLSVILIAGALTFPGMTMVKMRTRLL
ncbi:MAG: hypothetical protein KC470_05420, partial [Dehalococcoidia bacterium]|nr:hypothetical protein [Dehalococcoidia bacterium]